MYSRLRRLDTRGMRLLVGLCVLAACGGAAATHAPTKVTAPPVHEAPPLTPREMLRAFPDSTSMLFVIDAKKLRRSPLVMRAWDAMHDMPKVAELFESLCGGESRIEYVLLALGDDNFTSMWGWIRGLARTDKFECAKSRKDAKDADDTPTRTVDRGEYTLEASKKSTIEMLWTDPLTALITVHEAGTPDVTEPALRKAVTDGAGFLQDATFSELFEHVDFDSGAVLVMNGVTAKQPDIRGLAISVEADDGLRLQIYGLFDNEDRASQLQSEYRTALGMLLSKKLIESGEARAKGNGMAASITLSGPQAEWWLQYIASKYTELDPDAASPDPDGANGQ